MEFQLIRIDNFQFSCICQNTNGIPADVTPRNFDGPGKQLRHVFILRQWQWCGYCGGGLQPRWETLW